MPAVARATAPTTPYHQPIQASTPPKACPTPVVIRSTCRHKDHTSATHDGALPTPQCPGKTPDTICRIRGQAHGLAQDYCGRQSNTHPTLHVVQQCLTTQPKADEPPRYMYHVPHVLQRFPQPLHTMVGTIAHPLQCLCYPAYT